MVLGIVEKTKNKKQKTILFKDRNEVHSVAFRIGKEAKVFPFRYQLAGTKKKLVTVDRDDDDWYNQIRKASKENDKNTVEMWSLETKKSQPLVNGFFFIKLQILSIMRSKLTQLYIDVERMGGIPTAIHTDCIFFQFT